MWEYNFYAVRFLGCCLKEHLEKSCYFRNRMVGWGVFQIAVLAASEAESRVKAVKSAYHAWLPRQTHPKARLLSFRILSPSQRLAVWTSDHFAHHVLWVSSVNTLCSIILSSIAYVSICPFFIECGYTFVFLPGSNFVLLSDQFSAMSLWKNIYNLMEFPVVNFL